MNCPEKNELNYPEDVNKSGSEQFKLGLSPKDKEWFDYWVKDRWKTLFPKYKIFTFDVEVDELYGEEKRKVLRELGEIEIYISDRPAPVKNLTKHGVDTTQRLFAHIPKALFEEYNLPYLKEGDIIKAGDIYYMVLNIFSYGYVLHLDYPIILSMALDRWRPEKDGNYVSGKEF